MVHLMRSRRQALERGFEDRLAEAIVEGAEAQGAVRPEAADFEADPWQGRQVTQNQCVSRTVSRGATDRREFRNRDRGIVMLEYNVSARRIDSHGSEATTKQARIVLDTDMAGRADAFNPAEMLLASLAACILKGTERVVPMLGFDLRGIEVSLNGVRQDSPPKMVSIDYEIVVDTDESDARLDLLHRNLRKYGTVTNTLAEATELHGSIRRKNSAE